MRIVIVDLHCNNLLVDTYRSLLHNTKSIKKHSYFLEEALNEGYDVVDYISGTNSELIPGLLRKSMLFQKIEASFVLKKGGYSKRIVCISDPKEIKTDDLVIFYSVFNDRIDLLNLPGRKFCNANHFFKVKSTHGVPYSEFLVSDGFEGYIIECDALHDCSFFRTYLPVKNKRLLLLPYVAENRFQRTRDFYSRKNKAIALGSLTENLEKREKLIEFYGSNSLHPMRREIYEKKLDNPEQIDVEIKEVIRVDPPIHYREAENVIIHYLKALLNFVISMVHDTSSLRTANRSYYDRDMVELLNGYKMFIYPEDVTGVPALGFVEGMSCGCAYVGLDSPAYTKIGMVPGEHYIAYDGTYDDMVRKIRYYQEHGDELEKIAENGYRFVREHLNARAVFKNFIRQFEEL